MARVKAQKGERLDDEHIEKVIAHLAAGGKKKDAYDILNIKANSGRLDRIIEEYETRQATAARLRKANRGKPATEREIQSIIQGSLNGDPLTALADSMFRPIDFVKRIIDNVGIPQKQTGNWWDNRFSSSIPDQCLADEFDLYEIVWSDKYNGLAIVLGQEGPNVSIFVIEKIEEPSPYFPQYQGYGGKHASQKNYELGSLKHLEKFGIDLYKPYEPYFPNWLGKRNASKSIPANGASTS